MPLTPGAKTHAVFLPFMQEMVTHAKDNLHSIYITGSALTPDFDARVSDINSVVVLHKMDLKLLEWLAPLGKKYGKKKVAAPLVMTETYIQKSLDVFPIEFLNLKLLHACLKGENIFKDLDIHLPDLRNQCEREIKTRLIGLWQNYISSSGKRKILAQEFIRSFSGYIPLFRGVLTLLKEKPPLVHEGVLDALGKAANVDIAAFKLVLGAKHQGLKLSGDELNTLFEDYYAVMARLGDLIDDMAM